MAKTFIVTQTGLIPSRFLEEMARELRAGKLAAFPTDTVYGIGTSAESDRGIDAIYRLKGRSPLKPLPFLIESPSAAWRWAQSSPEALTLAQKYWPGPLTLVLNTTAEGKRLLKGAPTIGLRVPKHPALLSVIRELRGPLASTSANLSGQPSAARAEELKILEAAVDFILIEEDPLPGVESTVVDLSQGRENLRVLREGALPEAELRAALESEKAEEEAP